MAFEPMSANRQSMMRTFRKAPAGASDGSPLWLSFTTTAPSGSPLRELAHFSNVQSRIAQSTVGAISFHVFTSDETMIAGEGKPLNRERSTDTCRVCSRNARARVFSTEQS